MSAIASALAAPSLDGALARRTLLSTTELACRRGDRLLFCGLDFEVRAGDVVWLRGANGCGKTSLLRVLVGLARAAEGRLERDGAAGQAIYIGHANALKDDLTALEALQFLARMQGLSADADAEACAAALRRFGVHGRRHAMVRTLSQGQRRRVALARLLLAPAQSLWMLDEPFDALDTDGCATLREALAAHARGGGAVVLTSHLDPGLHDPEPTVVQLDAVATAPMGAPRAERRAAPSRPAIPSGAEPGRGQSGGLSSPGEGPGREDRRSLQGRPPHPAGEGSS